MPADKSAKSMQDPLKQFHAERQLARDAGDPMAHVCVLATVDKQGRPQARTLVLRNVNHEGQPRLALFINASSPKWTELANSESVSVQVYWPSVELQYRMQVKAETLNPQMVAESWQLRPDAPKNMDWLYQQQAQSTMVADRQALLSQLNQLKTPEPLVAPEGAKGLLLQIIEIERLDLTQSNGVHDRTQYTLNNNEWQKQTLVP
ncbi:MAG: pyridoxamine 5'-phosphate oxidase [Candidatus Azotimanducaceae bacterium]|jgi:pyridoxamine 5'-phosphate oxidase|tara:strand:- start:1032 stop:1646 length:615 start_codon:yes stop_codon:yes gene_type:complete